MRKRRFYLAFTLVPDTFGGETTARYQRAAASDQGLPQEGKRNG
jgi:hypothetical protein